MQFATLEELKTKLELTALARGMDATNSVVVTLNSNDTSNRAVRFVVGHDEPTGLDIPLNVLWYVRSPTSVFYGHIVRRSSRSPTSPYSSSWAIQSDLGLILTTAQVWDQPIPTYQDLYDHATQTGDAHNIGVQEIIPGLSPESISESGGTLTGPLYARTPTAGSEYASGEVVPRSWVDAALTLVYEVTENIIQAFDNINSQIDNLRTRVEILEQSLLGVRGFLFTAVTASATWNIIHNMNNSKVIVQVYENNEVVLPASIHVLSAQQVQVTFAVPVAGHAQVLPVIQLG
jgi:hypothetical protein